MCGEGAPRMGAAPLQPGHKQPVSNYSSLDQTTFFRRGEDASLSQEAMRRIFLRRVRGFAIFLIVLLACYMPFLSHWVQFGLDSDIFSYILLIPVISAYLIWLKRHQIPIKVVHRPGLGLAACGGGVLLLAGHSLLWMRGWAPEMQDHVALIATGFVLLLVGGTLLCFGSDITRFLTFPLAFLGFMIPFPIFLTGWIETFYQYTSADLSHALLRMTQTPVFREGLHFQLPGILLEVARECSGIRSSLVLFIASLLAGHLLLESTWRRWVLTLFVIPLGIFRNAFRILMIALLCVHVGPHMIDSPIHHRGGPIFFVLSLIPLFFLLVILKRTDRSRSL